MSEHVFDGLEGTVLPGFVDIQVNGGFGYDFTSDPSSIWEVGRRLPSLGVTAFVPTVISAPPEVALEAMAVVDGGPPPGWAGARPLGVHVEGPMISAAKRGTHPADMLVGPTPSLVSRLVDGGPPLMVTLAPELEGAEDAVRVLAGAGTVVALGHSAADAALAEQAFSWGARHATHLYNAMAGLHHRTPGLAAAVLLDDRVTTGLIADGVHVASEMLNLAFRMKGPDRIALVTDAVSAMGLADGTHRVGSVELLVDGIEVRNAAGALAGSSATMVHVLRTMMVATGCSPTDASTMASATPARIVGHRVGDGDLVLVDDDLEVVATSVGGIVLYRRDAP